MIFNNGGTRFLGIPPRKDWDTYSRSTDWVSVQVLTIPPSVFLSEGRTTVLYPFCSGFRLPVSAWRADAGFFFLPILFSLSDHLSISELINLLQSCWEKDNQIKVSLFHLLKIKVAKRLMSSLWIYVLKNFTIW